MHHLRGFLNSCPVRGRLVVTAEPLASRGAGPRGRAGPLGAQPGRMQGGVHTRADSRPQTASHPPIPAAENQGP